MECKECGSKWVVNKFFMLCEKCNRARLDAQKEASGHVVSKKRKTSLNRGKSSLKYGLSKRAVSVIQKDEELYEKVFGLSDHRCENCGKGLNTEFRDGEGKVMARWRYAHLVAKSIAPKLRHVVDNVVNLCLECHQQMDFGEKEKMANWKIFEEKICELRKK